MGPNERPSDGAGTNRRLWAALLCVLAAVVPAAVVGPLAASAASTGPVIAFGDVSSLGAPPGDRLNAPLTGMAATPDGKGYWLVGADGGVFTYGDAGFYGSEGGSNVLITPFVGIAPTTDGHGYWITGDLGNVYNFGDAPNEGALPRFPVAPVVGIAAAPTGDGYWLVGADGGVFTMGVHNQYYGSMGGKRLNAPMVGMAATPDGRGYWLVAADGGVFSFGDAHYYGSMGGKRLNAPVVGMASAPDGRGYWLVAADGGVFSFGDATFHGSTGATPASGSVPVAAMAAAPDGAGYWLATSDKALPPATPVPSVLAMCTEPTTGPSVTPDNIVLACADGNSFLSQLTWTSWTSSSATGSGFYTHNTCTPNCAEGTFVSVPASVRLSYPIETRAGREFVAITYTYANPAAPNGTSTVSTLLETSPG